jgi:hypothetical protein
MSDCSVLQPPGYLRRGVATARSSCGSGTFPTLTGTVNTIHVVSHTPSSERRCPYFIGSCGELQRF